MALIDEATPPAPPTAPSAKPPGEPPAAPPVKGPAPAKARENPVLERVKQEVESKLPEPLKEPYLRIIVAGMKLLYSDRTHRYMQDVVQRIQQSGHDPEKIANVMVNVLVVLYRESQGKMKVEAAFPAGVVLMADVLGYMEQTTGLQVTPDLVKAIGKAMAQKFVTAFQITTGAPEPPMAGG